MKTIDDNIDYEFKEGIMVKMIKPEDLKPIDNIIASTYWSDGDILKQDYSTCFHYIADNSFKYTRCSDKTDLIILMNSFQKFCKQFCQVQNLLYQDNIILVTIVTYSEKGIL